MIKLTDTSGLELHPDEITKMLEDTGITEEQLISICPENIDGYRLAALDLLGKCRAFYVNNKPKGLDTVTFVRMGEINND